MTRNIIFLSVILLTTSCLSRKTTQKAADLSTAVQREENMSTTQRLYLLQQRDSNHAVWHFRTDAPFFYHPDTGLRAEQGDLWLVSQTVHGHYLLKDSGETDVHTTDQRHSKEQTSLSEKLPAKQYATWWIVAGIIIAVGLYVVLRHLYR